MKKGIISNVESRREVGEAEQSAVFVEVADLHRRDNASAPS